MGSSNILIPSLLYGGGLYICTDEKAVDPLRGADGTCFGPVLENVLTGDRVFGRLGNFDHAALGSLKRHALLPPSSGSMFWPLDLVLIPGDLTVSGTSFVANCYSSKKFNPKTAETNSLLLFPLSSPPGLTGFVDAVSRLGDLSWGNKGVQHLAVSLVSAIESMNRSGYVYLDLHPSRMFVQNDGCVLLDYSPLILRMTSTGHDGPLASPNVGEYPIEFIEPAYANGLLSELDFYSQNYSLCAMLFWMFFGRYAYDGPILPSPADTNEQQHYIKFRDCHQLAVFIFDPSDTSNALGAFGEDERVIELWEECPECLKELFVAVLGSSNAKNRMLGCNPPPITWLKRFAGLGWTDGDSCNKGVAA